MESGLIVISKVRNKSTVTRCFSKYPLKFIIPSKAGTRDADCVWIYSLTYGGGIISGDSICCNLTIEDGCNAALTTQASTKVYKSMGLKCCEQTLEAKVGHEALLVVIPDPVTCFSTARYIQKQVFRVHSDSNLVLVDWFSSGRYQSGERWEFELYKSSNSILYDDDQPLFLDTVRLENGITSSLTERMQDYQVIAMVIILGPNLRHMQNQVQENVKSIMSQYLQLKPTTAGHSGTTDSGFIPKKPSFIASCSTFGPKGVGLTVRVAAMATEPVYQFLRVQLSCLEQLLGAFPYC